MMIKLPAGWLFDPEEEARVVHDYCDYCGCLIDDDTEIFLQSGEVIGCERCIDSFGAREANDKHLTDFTELKYDPFRRELRQIDREKQG